MLLRRGSRAALAAVALTALTGLGITACDSGSRAAPDGGSGPSILVPGAPGEANRTLSAQEAAGQRADDDSPNAADLAYARRMIEHHAQALEMTELAPDHAGSAGVRRLAARIAAAQGPEIEIMKSWLKSHGAEADGPGGGHEHASMPGMATEAQLKKLRAARGKAFDQLFLTLMISHHEGAITMAVDVKSEGNTVRIEEMADDVVAQQTSEITRMRAME
ncbi:DUF305 domain-containing protein [Streptomyces griseus]|uniref:DUF305 domain-containing protein n=1 Tax=Streptomyces griseus TaxID=1911 RepID=UPI00056379D2|nr:DUF305 domain-containing protein [Streptomyces griseus]